LKQLLTYFVFVLTLPLQAQDEEGEEILPGFEILSDRVLIETPDHWRGWDAPTGARLIQADGTVTPRLLRSHINAVYSAENDSILARVITPTNFQDGELVVDGDDRTYWEPDVNTDLSSWTLDIDLGRTLIAERIVVRFAAEGEGDPFLKFRVLTSDGLAAFGRSNQAIFSRVGLIDNFEGRREFAFDLVPQRKVAEGIEGAIVQTVRIDVLDTNGPRAGQVGFDEYQLLSAADRGATDYFLRTTRGREIAVSEATYADLPAEEKGPVRYYRRERPRLAEVEVFALGENIIAITQAEQEREALQLGRYDFLLFRTFTDGLFGSSRDMLLYNAVQDENQVEIDLGAKYWLDRVKLLSPRDPPFAYQIRISNGSVDPSGNFVWTNFDERRNLERFLHVEETFPRQEVRYIEVRQLEFSGSRFEKGKLSEIQAYGEGYVSEITMESPFIELGRPRLFTHVTWDGEAPPNTRVEIRTRTGQQVTLVPHYFLNNSREISEDLWRRLPDTEQTPRAPPIWEEITGPDWSNWSEVYTAPGDAFRSPAPRQLAKVQVRLLSAEPLQRAWIRSLRLHFVPPLVDTVLGEIFPVGGVEPGEDREFTLYLRPVFGAGNPGFDRVSLRSTSAAPLELLSVEVGPDAALRFGAGTRLWPDGQLQVAPGEEGEVVIDFPEPITNGDQVYAFRFRTKVFLQSTQFKARLESAVRPGLSQEIIAGDATDAVATQSLVVVSQLKDRALLENVEVAPSVFTPNGDDINDEVEIHIDIFHLEQPKTLGVEILDLSGHRVRDLSLRRSFPSGEHQLSWDGRDDQGQLLAPGIYLLRVHFDTDSNAAGTAVSRLVHLVY
jgi:hypothetical protein